MVANSLSEAYIKALTMCVTERLRRGIPRMAMAERLFISDTRLRNLEEMKTVDVRLVDEYMYEWGHKIQSKIGK